MALPPPQPITERWEMDIVNDIKYLEPQTKKISHPSNNKIKFIIDFYPFGNLNNASEFIAIKLWFSTTKSSNDEANFRLSIQGDQKSIIQGKFRVCYL